MSKMSTDPTRHALNGATMGTRWTALFYAEIDAAPVRAALQAAVDEVDARMSLWRPDSDLVRLNAAPVGTWLAVPERLMHVLALALDIGRASGGAFDIGMGDAVAAWGFGPAPGSAAMASAAMALARRPAHEVLELDPAALRLCKHAPLRLDLNGIAKGYGTDRLAEVLQAFGIGAGLVGIDGEMRALGLRPDGAPWAIAVEAPEHDHRAAHSVVALEDAAIATSGDYRHWVEFGGSRLSHTMDPRRGAPLASSPASVTTVARTCAEADAWATALMVLGPKAGAEPARRAAIDALFQLRHGKVIETASLGPLFAAPLDPGKGPAAGIAAA